MKRLAKYVVLLLLPLFVVACGGREIDSKLDVAEAVMSERPDSALTILRTIDADKLYSPSRKARYSLVLSETYYYQALPIDNDSLTRVAYDYYISNKNSQIRARAMYQHAMVMYTSNEMAESMVALLEAEKDFDYFDNNRLKGLIETLKGDIYSANIIFEEALESYTRSLQYYECTNLDYHLQYALFDKAQMLLWLNRFEEAEPILLGVIDECVEQDYKGLLCNAIHCLCDLYIRCEKYEKCSDVLKLFDKYECLEFHNSHYYLLMALVESTRNNRSLALEYLEYSDQYENTYFEEVEYIKGRVYENIGLLEDSNYWFKRHKEQQDSVVLRALSHPIGTMQRDYFKSVSDYNRLKVEHQRFIIFGAIVFIVVISLLFYVYIRSKNAQVQHYMEMACDMRTSLFIQENNMGEIVSTMSSMQEQIASLFSRQYSLIDRLCSTYYETHSSNTTRDAIYKQVKSEIERLSVDVKYIRNLESIVNQHKQNAIAICREQAPELTEMEVRVLIYLLAGFSAKAISIFTNDSVGNIYTKKNRLKNKLRTINTPEINSVLQLL